MNVKKIISSWQVCTANVLIILSAPEILRACPGCNAFLEGNIAGHGFNASIFFMMAMPFFVVGGVAAVLVIHNRKKNRDNDNIEDRISVFNDKAEETKN